MVVKLLQVLSGWRIKNCSDVSLTWLWPRVLKVTTWLDVLRPSGAEWGPAASQSDWMTPVFSTQTATRRKRGWLRKCPLNFCRGHTFWVWLDQWKWCNLMVQFLCLEAGSFAWLAWAGSYFVHTMYVMRRWYTPMGWELIEDYFGMKQMPKVKLSNSSIIRHA